MKNSTIFSVLLGVFALGCVEVEEGLYIDSSCTVEEQEWAAEGIEKLNAAMGYERVVNLGVRDKVGDNLVDQVDWILCDPADIPRVLGRAVTGDIHLYAHKFPGDHDAFLNVLLHELGHYVGFSGHLEENTGILFGQISVPPRTDYTDDDVAALRSTDTE